LPPARQFITAAAASVAPATQKIIPTRACQLASWGHMQTPILIRLMTFRMAEILSKTEPRRQSYEDLSQKDTNDILTNIDGQVCHY
jgi:hypothetical protein